MTSNAAAVAESKRKNPSAYCRHPDCLWRIVTRHGPNPCMKHPQHTPVPPRVREEATS